jgi:hypothetical protein
VFRHLTIALLMTLLPSLSLADRHTPNQPTDAKLITTDINNFWEAFDALADADSVDVLQRLYFDRGSQGLLDFVTARIKSVEHLSRQINAHPKYYTSLREPSLKVAQAEDDIYKSFANLKRMYPDAHFPDVYFLIGRMNSGGTTSGAGLLIGVDMYGLTDDTPTDEFGKWHRQVVSAADGIPHIVAHELIHYEQPPLPQDKRTLLASCIREGSADFIAELISGRHINGHVHDYCLPREAALWEEFQTVMNGTEFDGWLYGGQPEDRPADMGYFVGYRIAQAYYNNTPDKKAAIRDILIIDDFNAFLVASGYSP